MGAREPPTDGRLEHGVVQLLLDRRETLATAESFTGGQLAAALTSVAGASAVFPLGWVTYASEQKTTQLGVPALLIESRGVVSDQVAAAMAEGALARAGTSLALATTGWAGPAAPEQPGGESVSVGRCFIALARPGHQTQVRGFDFAPPRENVQRMGVQAALAMVLEALARP